MPQPQLASMPRPSPLAVTVDNILFERAPVAQLCVAFDSTAREQSWRGNAAWRARFGPSDAWLPTEVKATLLAALKAEAGEVALELSLPQAHGDAWPCLLSARMVQMSDGALLLIHGVDVSTVKSAMDAHLREYEEMVQSASDTILLIEDGRIIECNPAAEILFGRGRDELLGVHPSIYSTERQDNGELSSELAPKRIREAMQGICPTFTWRHVRPDGTEFIAEVAFNPMRGRVPSGQTQRRFIWVLRDVTEQEHAREALESLNATLELRVKERTQALQDTLTRLQRTQTELIRSEKLAGLGALVAGVAHELNTPIGNAVMVASTLRDVQKRFDRQVTNGLRRSMLADFQTKSREALEVIERNLGRAAELIMSFKQVAVDQSSYQRRPFELGEVLHELHLTLSPTLRRAQVQVIDQVQPGLRMDSYPGPMTQILMNLVNNTVVHAFPPASALVPGTPSPARTVRITGEPLSERCVRITVTDNGFGIPVAVQEKVFDPFFTTRMGQGGSGLGLHIVYSLVTDLLGGRVSVQSELGKGATFTIDMPRHAPQPQSPRARGGDCDA